MPHQDDDIAREIHRLLAAGAPDGSICPSQVARSLQTDEQAWRALMPHVRDVARRMAVDGSLLITQRGAILDPNLLPPGPIRLRRGPRSATP